MTASERNVQQAARRQFLERLLHHLMEDPYWIHVLGTGKRQERRRLGEEIGRMVTTIPKMSGQPVPNRKDRRAILLKGRPDLEDDR